MADRRAKKKGRLERGSFLALPHDYIRAAQFNEMSPKAVKAFLQLAAQYRGTNNGLLALPRSQLKKLGWASHHTLRAALAELVDTGWAVVTRPGGKHAATLYALTIWAVDDCGMRHQHPATATASNDWRNHKRWGSDCPPQGHQVPQSPTEAHRHAA